MYCSECGSPVAGAKFCRDCGAATSTSSTSGTTLGASSTALHPSVAPPPAADLQQPTPLTPPRVTFGEAIGAGFRGYVVWNARSTRAEYWWWALFNFLVLLSALIVDAILTGGLLYFVAVIALFLPNLSVLIRRLHDLDKSGGWFWFGLIPIAGPIVLLVFALTPSEPRATRWNRSLLRDS